MIGAKHAAASEGWIEAALLELTPIQTQEQLGTRACQIEVGLAFPGLTPAQSLQREENLTGLTPKRPLITRQTVERVGGEIAEADKRFCEIVGRFNRVQL